jgi:hypothetical protein
MENDRGEQADDIDRIRAAKQEAYELGYLLFVDEAYNSPPPITHMAFAGPHVLNQVSAARFLTYSTSAADAAEAGLEVLRGILAGQRDWPD